MTPETAQKLWDTYCGELIDNGDKTSEDVRQALATFLRVLTDYCGGYYDARDYELRMITSKDLLDTANLLENLK
jgi:hypothetical protein